MFFVSDASLDAILADDLPYGDETTSLFLQGSQQGALVAEAKTEGIVCGVALAARLLRRLGSVCDVHVEDGSYVPAHAPLLCARGSVEQLLGAYKMAQVIMEYTTGITRRTAAMVAAAERVSPNCRIALTRKHFPGAKRLSLYAALCAGGTLHRSSLSESVLLFDAHLSRGSSRSGKKCKSTISRAAHRG